MDLDHLKKGANTPAIDPSKIPDRPEWFNEDRFQRGQQFFRKHLAAHLLALYCSLLSGLGVVNLLVALIFTGQSDTPSKAYARYLRTYFHICWWVYGNIWDKENNAYKSISNVRNLHHGVSQAMKKDTGKLHISQYDLALVQCGFMGAVSMYPKGFGLVCVSQQDVEDYIFFWRCIGFQLGIMDEYNICSGNYQQHQFICHQIQNEIVVPAMTCPPPNFKKMADAFVVGMNSAVGFQLMSIDATYAFVYQIMELDGPKLSFKDKLRYFFLRVLVFMIGYMPGFEKITNLFANLFIQKLLKSQPVDAAIMKCA